MAKIMIPASKQPVYKKLGLLLVAVFTVYVFFHGAQYARGSAPSPKYSTVLSSGSGYQYSKVELPKYTGPREKATFVTLVRNRDLYSLAESIKSVEDRFNSKFNYDWVFLNDEEFTDEFKNVTSALVSGTTKYGVIPKEHWSFPDWIDEEKAAQVRKEMGEKRIIYGDSISYRHMCRFESGFFYRHPLMDDYDWYWRVEPDIKLHCDIDYDVFKFMKDNKKKYAFAISIKEYEATIPTLWETTRKFMESHPELIHENNMLDFVSDDQGLSYNLCHFWSNFEIAALDLWRSPAYSAYFDYLDHEGGFFYERWGDAPVHSIGAALFLDRSEIHHFGDIGYYHVPFHSCPIDTSIRLANKCDCDPSKDFTWHSYSCTTKFYNINKLPKPAGWQNHIG
ncbi:AIC_G0049820.mRNA.1.CDS.1 [Saccharomyces cerevisiae]|uniref:Ktr1p n=2 Tax=Saccharomyces cerevisiae TaxID=4932 RepID=C8ZI60_YEAS8|nr:Ktr1p [Saccharomyces cerevisiae YJM270]CAI4768398.1 AIC_G0049820.mRNA.1.CDS.1 [Saccharomyces cerevisiae]CAI6882155.1 AIC_G0049820.mRNA.1.CDS.1 [Saccharomyces cerevisiae]CAY86385.1 Ktr1p [Saccharomyces cerevisiae EC1118]